MGGIGAPVAPCSRTWWPKELSYFFCAARACRAKHQAGRQRVVRGCRVPGPRTTQKSNIVHLRAGLRRVSASPTRICTLLPLHQTAPAFLAPPCPPHMHPAAPLSSSTQQNSCPRHGRTLPAASCISASPSTSLPSHAASSAATPLARQPSTRPATSEGGERITRSSTASGGSTAGCGAGQRQEAAAVRMRVQWFRCEACSIASRRKAKDRICGVACLQCP